MIRFIRWLASKLPCRDIYGEDGTLYLSRYRVFGWMPGDARRWPFSIYLHRFHRPDLDDAPHSHPWSALSLILTGGYTERRLAPRSWQSDIVRTLRPGSINRLKRTTFHVITTLHGETWTLMFVGPKTQTWGFWVDGRGFVPWRERLAERGLTPDY